MNPAHPNSQTRQMGGVEKTDAVLALLRILAGVLFIVSGFSKLMQPYQNFMAVVDSYDLLNRSETLLFAQAVPWVEYFGGLFLFLGLWTRESLVLLWVLNSAFIVALSSALWRKLPIQDCGCFGKAATLSPKQTLALDTALWVVFVVLWALRRGACALGLDRR